jgi:hypothetical protein
MCALQPHVTQGLGDLEGVAAQCVRVLSILLDALGPVKVAPFVSAQLADGLLQG